MFNWRLQFMCEDDSVKAFNRLATGPAALSRFQSLMQMLREPSHYSQLDHCFSPRVCEELENLRTVWACHWPDPVRLRCQALFNITPHARSLTMELAVAPPTRAGPFWSVSNCSILYGQDIANGYHDGIEAALRSPEIKPYVDALGPVFTYLAVAHSLCGPPDAAILVPADC